MNYQFYTDDDLLNAMKEGNGDSFKEIYLRYWKPLYFTALKKVRMREVAEELVQNVLVGLWNKRQTAEIKCLQSYLYNAIKYQVINHLDSKIIREKHTHRAFADLAIEAATCDSAVLTHELSAAIDRAIKKLPDKTQTILRLSRLENYSNRQISEVMRMSEKSVEYHITRSLKLMRTYLKDFLLLLLAFFVQS
ncbi:MAG: sigma-70 family RNA polymerase sigma factor [Bacteroidota bacterium]